MVPILYATVTEGSVPTNYGIGPLTDCLSAEVTEERNGSYELRLEYAAQGIHAEDITPNKFIKAKPNFTDDPQLFRIYKVGKAINGRFEVNAQHISYDMSGKLITSGTAANCAAACALLQSSAGSFTINTDKGTSATFKVSQPSSVRSWFGGKAGSLLDVYGGEWYFDNYTASLKTARGTNRGVQIRYGKNLTELSQELDMSNLATAILPYYIDQNGNVTTGAKVSTGLVLDVPREIAVDFSNDVKPESSTPIATQLANLADKYKNNNNLTTLTNSIKLDFVQTGETLDRVDLCDTVSIYFEALGITASAKCIETVWDVLAERYTSVTFGASRANIADTIAVNQLEIEQTASRDAVARATQLITGNLGGYVILHDSDNDGEPDEILIMNTADISTATKVWRWNKSGLGYSSTGYSGPYGLAMTSNGEIVADYISTGNLDANLITTGAINASLITAGALDATIITTGNFNADLIKVGTISDVAGNSSINMTNGAAVMKDFQAKNSFKFVDDNGIERGNFSYTAADGASLQLIDQNRHQMAWLLSDQLGGSLYLNNSEEQSAVELTVDGNDAGVVYVCAVDGTDTIDLLGYNGHIWCTQVHQSSSRKIKKNIEPIEDARKILELDAVKFDFKEEEKGTNCRGFIAEDVAKVIPNLVVPEDDRHPASLDYIGMIPYLQAVIKEQDKRIAALEEKIKNLGG